MTRDEVFILHNDENTYHNILYEVFLYATCSIKTGKK